MGNNMDNHQASDLPVNRPMPTDRAMRTVDELVVHAPLDVIFDLARTVGLWPVHLSHYRYVRFSGGGGDGTVSMSANRPFGFFNWPTWWRSQMHVDDTKPSIRFYHVGGITKGMDVEWEFHQRGNDTHVRIVHVWNGPKWLGLPLIGKFAATRVIGPIFVHGIASRTLAGLAKVAEKHGITE
jgi:hypothetical protein